MLLILRKLKGKAEAENGELLSFLDAKTKVRCDGKEVHSAALCTKLKSFKSKEMKLSVIIGFNPDCQCLGRSLYSYPNGEIRALVTILELMRDLASIPTFDELKTTAADGQSRSLERFGDLIMRRAEYELLASGDLADVTMDTLIVNWLHEQKGYPKTLNDTLDAYLDVIEEHHQLHVVESILSMEIADTRSSVELSAKARASRKNELQQILANETAATRRIICVPEPESGHETIVTFGFHGAILFAAVKKLLQADSGLVALTPLLANSAMKCGLVDLRWASFADVTTTPTQTALLTARALNANGMTLEAAIESSSFL